MLDALDLIDIDEMCELGGGKNRPLHRATIYRLVKAGRLSPPRKLGPNISRWERATAIAEFRAMYGEAAPEAA